MLLIREVARLVRSIVHHSVATGRVWVLVGIVLAAIVALVATSVTVIGPVSLYPFL